MRYRIQLFAALGPILSVASSGLQRSSSPPILPNLRLTPRDTLDVTNDDICVPGYI